MPHTSSRKKKKPEHNKRREVTDDDGWTHVTSGPKMSIPKAATTALGFHPDGEDFVINKTDLPDGSTTTTYPIWPLRPAEDMTLEKLQNQYRRIEGRWQESESCRKLKEILSGSALPGGRNISTCVCFGTGSLSGVRNGWLERHEVAMYQITAFKSVVDTIEEIQGSRPAAFAQEPCYNPLDEEFLSTLSITKVDHPTAFCLLTRNSFAFCPGAEQNVNLRTLSLDPAIYLGSSLDLYRGRDGRLYADFIRQARMIGNEFLDADKLEDLDAVRYRFEIEDMREDQFDSSRVVDAYRKGKETRKLPDLDVKNYPFYDQHLTWRVSEQEYPIPWSPAAYP